jgi:hypothetical protein
MIVIYLSNCYLYCGALTVLPINIVTEDGLNGAAGENILLVFASSHIHRLHR